MFRLSEDTAVIYWSSGEAEHGFVNEFEHLGVQGPSITSRAGAQSLVELFWNITHVESCHIVMLAFC